jgi:hypothetical protein
MALRPIFGSYPPCGRGFVTVWFLGCEDVNPTPNPQAGWPKVRVTRDISFLLHSFRNATGDLPNFLFYGYRSSIHGSTAAGSMNVTTHFYLQPRLRTHGAVPPLPNMHERRARRQLHFHCSGNNVAFSERTPFTYRSSHRPYHEVPLRYRVAYRIS